jgi:hypothetical protein
VHRKGHQEPDGFPFQCPSREDECNVLRRGPGIGFTLLGLFASCAASVIVDKNVVHLHGNKIEALRLCSSSQGESVCHFTLCACMCLTEAIVHSAWLKQQVSRILPPYIHLGFDQQVIAIAKNKVEVTVHMQNMETIEFISQYGRPMYADLARKLQLLILLPGGVHCQK